MCCCWQVCVYACEKVVCVCVFKHFYSGKTKHMAWHTKFSQSHGKLENYNIGLKYKRKKVNTRFTYIKKQQSVK